MNTTSLLVDFLVIGVQAAVWLTLLFLSLFGLNPWANISVKGYEAILGVLALSIVYPLGILIDHIADVILRRAVGDALRAERLKDKADENVMELLFKAKDPNLWSFYGYLRMRIRVSRSSSFNFILIGLCAFSFIVTRLDGQFLGSVWLLAFVVAAISWFVALMAFVVWRDLTVQFFDRQMKLSDPVNRAFLFNAKPPVAVEPAVETKSVELPKPADESVPSSETHS